MEKEEVRWTAIYKEEFNLKKDILSGKIKGAIFDLDGTLVDSMGVWARIDQHFLERRNIPVPLGLTNKVMSMTLRETAYYFKEEFNLSEDVEEIMNEWNTMALHEYTYDVRLKAGVKQLLLFLKIHKVALALATTNCQLLLEVVLKNNEIWHLFSAITSLEEVMRGKDNPDIYLLTAEKLGLKPDTCVVFEDILPAVKGARKAGMKVVGVYDPASAHDQKLIQREAHSYIESFEDYF